MELLETYETALNDTGALVATVTDDQLSLATPCSEWDVAALIGHVIGGNWMFASAVTGEAGGAGDPADRAASYAASVAAVLAAWRRPGAMEQIVKLPFGEMPGQAVVGLHLVDNVTHRWDLAKALGVEAPIDPDLAGGLLVQCKANIQESFRGPGRPFGPEVVPPAGAPNADQLAAFLGRTV